MNERDVKRLLTIAAHARVAGSREERQCAALLADECAARGLAAHTEVFPLMMYREGESALLADGSSVPCRVRFGCRVGEVTAPFYYLSGSSETDLRKCRGRVVLSERAIGYSLYDRLVAHGALGLITTCGTCMDTAPLIDERFVFFTVPEEARLPWVTVHLSDALAMVTKRVRNVTLRVRYTAYAGESQNVILDLPGETDETVVISAHYDSTDRSSGAYDNLSGAITLLYLAEHLSAMPRRRSVRLLWCGAEERGLLGSLAYCDAHRKERAFLNVNLDMLGCAMGEFTAFSSADEETVHLLERMGSRHRFPLCARHGIRSSDSNSFVRAGIPAVSFARYSPSGVVQIHTPSDTAETVLPQRLLEDARFVLRFVDFAVNDLSYAPQISPSVKEEVDGYFKRKCAVEKV